MKNFLWLFLGLVVGSVVNMSTIMIGSMLVTPPAGVDPESMESIRTAMAAGLYLPVHFVTPFLAHAGGTLAGAFFVSRQVTGHSLLFSLGIGAFFLVGGAMMASMMPTPTWFAALDLVVAYLPMAWLGDRLTRNQS